MVDRLVIDIYGCALIGQFLHIIHDENPVEHGKGFFLIMGDKDKSDAQARFAATPAIRIAFPYAILNPRRIRAHHLKTARG